MRYTVAWLPIAEDELMNLWIQGPDRQAVTDASNRMECTLKRDADQKGFADNGQRILVVSPLTFIFTVSPDDRLVTILWVERI